MGEKQHQFNTIMRMFSMNDLDISLFIFDNLFLIYFVFIFLRIASFR